MLSLEQAQEAILAAVTRGVEQESVLIAEADGRFLADDVAARVDNPAFDNSAMDGYALRLADLPADRTLPLAGVVSCGDAPGALLPKTAMRIFTGAPLPFGADAVAMQEDVDVREGRVTLPAELGPGENIRRRAEDFRAGERLYAAGHRISSADIALLATAGCARLPVRARARVLVISTGNELVAPGEALRPGQIYESNRVATLAQLRRLGVAAEDGGTVRDEPAALRELLARSGEYDFLITSGGASVGDHDLVKQVFAEIGTITFWKARVKPGKPIAFGRTGERTHFFALPGNPVSSLVTYKLFVEPALIHWHGGVPSALALKAVAANAFQRKPGRTEFLRARLHNDGQTLRVEMLKGQGSHMLKPLRDTNALIRVEHDSAGFGAGDTVTVLPLGLMGA